MIGLRYDFGSMPGSPDYVGDIVIDANGSFATALIDSQNAALITLTQVCRITKPEIGAQAYSFMTNRTVISILPILSEAKRMVERDGGSNVQIEIIDGNLKISATYDN